MSKKDNISKMTNFLSLAVSHRIGSIANPDAIYAPKYKKEAFNHITQARAFSLSENWNSYDKLEIKTLTKKKAITELSKKPFLNDKKFDLVDEEVDKILKELDIN